MSTTVSSVLAVWLVLMVSTAASAWWLSTPRFEPAVSNLAVFLVATVKVALVMAFFMELRRAPRGWQAAGGIWLVAAAGTVIGLSLG